jgi:hypothetical protein
LHANASNHFFSFEVLAQLAYFGLEVAEVPVDADYHAEHTSIPLGQATAYAFSNLRCLAKFGLARAGLVHSAQFPPLGAAS